MKQPPCANWNVWIGREVEGHISIDKSTLFIRRIDFPHQVNFKELKSRWAPKINRVWFCKEFNDMDVINSATKYFKEVCVELTLSQLTQMIDCNPREARSFYRKVLSKVFIYLKVGNVLKQGDHICVGNAFREESFVLNNGRRVTLKNYLGDKRIL